MDVFHRVDAFRDTLKARAAGVHTIKSRQLFTR
jgi:hypothetical protein